MDVNIELPQTVSRDIAGDIPDSPAHEGKRDKMTVAYKKAEQWDRITERGSVLSRYIYRPTSVGETACEQMRAVYFTPTGADLCNRTFTNILADGWRVKDLGNPEDGSQVTNTLDELQNRFDKKVVLYLGRKLI